jgi:hypothetical protein
MTAEKVEWLHLRSLPIDGVEDDDHDEGADDVVEGEGG